MEKKKKQKRRKTRRGSLLFVSCECRVLLQAEAIGATAMSWSLTEGSPTECGVSVIYKPQ